MTAQLGLTPEDFGIASSVFVNPMTLIPVQEIDRWYSLLDEKTQKPNIVLEYSRSIQLSQLGALGRWLFHNRDLVSTVRRVNVALGSLQSGGYLSASMTGTLIKWCYHNPNFSVAARVHDSVRVAIFMLKILREYLGDDFVPSRVMCTGKRSDDHLYEEYFGCKVEWNHSQTEVWFDSKVRQSPPRVSGAPRPNLAMSYHELDDYLNMPSADDHIKVVYEVINYISHDGLPTLERTAQIVGLSSQQLQRKLRAMNVNFTQMMGYVLSSVATKHLRNGVSVDDVSKLLGYENRISFERMFKKQRGITPTQYIKLHL